MNRFLDVHGVLDADYERAAPDDARIRAVLLSVRQPTRLAGNVLVVVDKPDDTQTTSSTDVIGGHQWRHILVCGVRLLG